MKPHTFMFSINLPKFSNFLKRNDNALRHANLNIRNSNEVIFVWWKLRIEIKVNLHDWYIQYQIEEANYEQ